MSTRDTVLATLKEVKPNYQLENVNDLIDGGYLDSLDLMTLISSLMDKFDFDLDIEWITPDNFNSVDAISTLIDRIKK